MLSPATSRCQAISASARATSSSTPSRFIAPSGMVAYKPRPERNHGPALYRATGFSAIAARVVAPMRPKVAGNSPNSLLGND